MPYPWDPLPFPITGDADANETYAGVGVVMSEWESIEFNLARLYSVFVGDGPSGMAIQDYGKPRIFRDRRANLERIAETYFVSRSNQKLEGGFKNICTAASGFADRRNEVAHGIVMEVGKIQFFVQKLHLAKPGERQHLVVPPYYTIRNHDKFFNVPLYAFNAGQMREIAVRFIGLGKEISDYRESL